MLPDECARDQIRLGHWPACDLVKLLTWLLYGYVVSSCRLPHACARDQLQLGHQAGSYESLILLTMLLYFRRSIMQLT
jgi:hypothetical protein